mgnify:CR=1 FL=1
MSGDEVKVTRKYQVTIPRRLRSEFGIKVGDKILLRKEGSHILIEVPRRIADPSEFLWNLSKKPVDVDVVSLIEESWKA